MKRIAVILLVLLYLVPAIGVTVSAHHCGGVITSVSLKMLDFGHKCPCGKLPMKKDCCRDETTTFRLSEEQQKTQAPALKAFSPLSIQAPCTGLFTLSYAEPLVEGTFSIADHPPDDSQPPLFIRHRVFRI